MARLGPFFDPQNAPERVYVGPFLCSFPGNEAHKLFSGAQNGGFGWGKKVYVEKVYVLFLSLTILGKGMGYERTGPAFSKFLASFAYKFPLLI